MNSFLNFYKNLFRTKRERKVLNNLEIIEQLIKRTKTIKEYACNNLQEYQNACRYYKYDRDEFEYLWKDKSKFVGDSYSNIFEIIKNLSLESVYSQLFFDGVNFSGIDKYIEVVDKTLSFIEQRLHLLNQDNSYKKLYDYYKYGGYFTPTNIYDIHIYFRCSVKNIYYRDDKEPKIEIEKTDITRTKIYKFLLYQISDNYYGKLGYDLDKSYDIANDLMSKFNLDYNEFNFIKAYEAFNNLEHYKY